MLTNGEDPWIHGEPWAIANEQHQDRPQQGPEEDDEDPSDAPTIGVRADDAGGGAARALAVAEALIVAIVPALKVKCAGIARQVVIVVGSQQRRIRRTLR